MSHFQSQGGAEIASKSKHWRIFKTNQVSKSKVSPKLKTFQQVSAVQLIMNQVVVCSEIKGLKEALVRVLPQVKFSSVTTSELEKEDGSDFKRALVADTDKIIPFLYKKPKAFAFAQGTWAGIDPLLPHIKDGVAPELPVCRFAHENLSGLMAEFAVGQVIAWERGFHGMMANQRKHLWKAEERQSHPRVFSDITVGILGLGQMGLAVANRFKVSQNKKYCLQTQTGFYFTESRLQNMGPETESQRWRRICDC